MTKIITRDLEYITDLYKMTMKFFCNKHKVHMSTAARDRKRYGVKMLKCNLYILDEDNMYYKSLLDNQNE
jgi:hypothetical protein